MNRTRPILQSMVLCGAALVIGPAGAYRTPSETPAETSALAGTSPLLAVTRAGSRLVAVGLRGHIVYSDDDGKTWTQARVPVSSDLVALSFPSAQQGWAVGHGGVVLHSADGGATWTKQLDGPQAAALTEQFFSEAQAIRPTPDVARALRQAKTAVAEGNTQSLLAVRFESDKAGFVVGTFNRIFRTEDGGKTWAPWMDRTDNPKEYHFYSIASAGQDTYLSGERGMVWRLDRKVRRFVAVPTSYNGTLFGLLIDGRTLLAYGMRGSLMRSHDDGKTWDKLSINTAAGITGAAALADGRIVVATQAGDLLLSQDQGSTFQKSVTTLHMPFYGLAVVSPHQLALVGPYGAKVEFLP